MIQLYHNDMSSCAQKVRIVLAEKGLEWESHHLSLREGESRTSEYKKLNPNGVVPTLITDSNETIIESTVIMEYFRSRSCQVLVDLKRIGWRIQRLNIEGDSLPGIFEVFNFFCGMI